MLLRAILGAAATRGALNRCFSHPPPLHITRTRVLLAHNYNILSTRSRFYCTEKKKQDDNNSDINREKESPKDSETPASHNQPTESEKSDINKIVSDTQEPSAQHEKTTTGEKSEEKPAGAGDTTSTGDKTSTGEGEKAGTGENTGNTGSTGEESRREELPPWWPSLPLWKKILYPSLVISLVSFITELIYASTLRSTLPYKQAIHVISGVDEIEEAFGEIKQPKWYRFWEVLYGYYWVQANGYEGISKLWIPITGVKEYKTDKLDKNGDPVMGQIFTRGRAYAEAKKHGAGTVEWELTYLIVHGEKLGIVTTKDDEWLDANSEGRVKPIPGQMVLVNKHVQIEGS